MNEIKRDLTTKAKWYCVLHNPNVTDRHTEVIFGGSELIVKNKIERQLKIWKKEISE